MKLEMNEDGLLDLVFENGIVMAKTIHTALLTSLLLNRRAGPDDVIPQGYQGKEGALTDDRQGWVGDILDDRGRLVGSKLWLLAQELATEETIRRARQYIREAVQWAVDDGYIRRVDIDDEWRGANRSDLHVTFVMTNGDLWTLRVNYETGAVYEL